MNENNRLNTFYLSLIILILSFPCALSAEEFIGRQKYPDNPTIELRELHDNFDDYSIVDARSTFEFDIIHITGAKNIPLNSFRFERELRKLSKKSDNPIVFYCNGYSCLKSHKAVAKAKLYNLSNELIAYDAGIFHWAETYPDKTQLLGTSPADTTKLLSKQQLAEKTISAKQFLSDIQANKDIIVWDIRDKSDSLQNPILKERSHRLSLNNKRFIKSIELYAIDKTKPVYIFDNVGKQIRWFQYHLENHGISNYYFLKGGAASLNNET